MEFFKNIWDAIMTFYSSQPLVTFLISVGLLLVVIAFVVALIVTTCKLKKKVNKAQAESAESRVAEKLAASELGDVKLLVDVYAENETALKLKVSELESKVETLTSELEKTTEDFEIAKLESTTANLELDRVTDRITALETENAELRDAAKVSSVLADEKSEIIAEKEVLVKEKTELSELLANVTAAYEKSVKELNKVRTENDILINAIHIKTPGKAKKVAKKAAQDTSKEYAELAKMTRTELANYAKELGLTGYTQLKRADLVTFIYEKITK